MKGAVGRFVFRHRVEAACVVAAAGFSAYLFDNRQAIDLAAAWLGAPVAAVRQVNYLALAAMNAGASFLRVWAGGTLGAARMMAFDVRTDRLIVAGPYAHLRNPIYAADIVSLGTMALVVPPAGAIAMLALLAFIYPVLMRHEEAALLAARGDAYARFRDAVPRLVCRPRAYEGAIALGVNWREGVLNNFLYLPLVPGFLVCAVTGVLGYGVLIGAAGPVGWVILHFARNARAAKAVEE
ncbi:hypothetical protein K8I61_05735 [bacterium]|nr:hypothetical protein [bacterium]